jgi:hypothetical protein
MMKARIKSYKKQISPQVPLINFLCIRIPSGIINGTCIVPDFRDSVHLAHLHKVSTETDLQS